MSKYLIDIQNATVARSNTILDKFTFRIAPFEHTAIIGPNGCGKSTFIRMLMRDLYPTYVPGDEAISLFKGQSNWSMAQLRQSIGLISMKFADALAEIDGLGVYDSVASSYFGTFGFYKATDLTTEMKTRIDETLIRLDLAALATRTIRSLSTGQLRKVLIGRAMVLQPDLLLLDEPTLGLDIRAQRDFLSYLEYSAETATIVMVTHSLEEIVPMIKKVLLIKDGKVFAFGDREAILTSENLSNLFGLDLAVRRSEAGDYSMHWL
jgi:iron complex transport system ATP-binding protein